MIIVFFFFFNQGKTLCIYSEIDFSDEKNTKIILVWVFQFLIIEINSTGICNSLMKILTLTICPLKKPSTQIDLIIVKFLEEIMRSPK